MPQPKKGPALGSNPSHQRLMLRNLARSLFEHERIQTTETKAKLLRPYAERLITKAKKGTVHHRRQVLELIDDRELVHKLFADIAPRFSARSGGYTRIVKIGARNGDGAPMALIELLQAGPATSGPAVEESRRRRLRRGRRRAGAGDLPEDKPARSRAAEAGAAGTPPATGARPSERPPAAQEPPTTGDDAGDADAGASGATAPDTGDRPEAPEA